MSQYTYIPPPPYIYSSISHPLERYLGMLDRGCREKLFLMGDRKHRDDLKNLQRGDVRHRLQKNMN